MTFLVERLAELRQYLEHLESLRPRVTGAEDLRRDRSLHNDVLFSLLMVAQLVIDIASELSSRRAMRFEDYTEAVRNLGTMNEFPDELVQELSTLPGFRNILIHEYVALDLERAVAAMDRLEPIERFAAAAARAAAEEERERKQE